MPTDAEHAALAIEYSHVTAPLRRLVDRYAAEICVALCDDQPVPDWVLRRLDGLVEEMAGAERRAKKYERAIIDLVEAFLLRQRVGEEFVGTVIDVERDRHQGTVMIAEPAVAAKVSGSHLPLGQQVRVRLVSADLGGRIGRLRAGLSRCGSLSVPLTCQGGAESPFRLHPCLCRKVGGE